MFNDSAQHMAPPVPPTWRSGSGQVGPGPADAVEAVAPSQQGNCGRGGAAREGGDGGPGDGGGCDKRRGRRQK